MNGMYGMSRNIIRIYRILDEDEYCAEAVWSDEAGSWDCSIRRTGSPPEFIEKRLNVTNAWEELIDMVDLCV